MLWITGRQGRDNMLFDFVTLANEKYKRQQDRLVSIAGQSKKVRKIKPWSFEDLKQTNFYQENKHILDQPRGCGYWLWKPYIILEQLNQPDPPDVVFYIDCGDIFNPEVFNYAEHAFQTNNCCLLLNGSYAMRFWTKRDCFVLMGCDSEKYWNQTMIEAGAEFWKNDGQAKTVLNEWLTCCKDERLLTDIDNTCGLPNLDNFQDHRHDQCILTNLAIKHSLYIDSGLMRMFITCNVDD